MPWAQITLNDGRKLPEIGFGTWTAGSGDQVVDQVEQAIETGFEHIGTAAPALPRRLRCSLTKCPTSATSDTAQIYGNESETGEGIKESGEKPWVTTKWCVLADGGGTSAMGVRNLPELVILRGAGVGRMARASGRVCRSLLTL